MTFARSISTLIGAALVSSILISPIAVRAQDAAPKHSFIDAEGTLHVRELTIPPSDLWSPEFASYKAAAAAQSAASAGFKVPPKEDKAGWERFIEQSNHQWREHKLPQLLAAYPVTIEDTRIGGVSAQIIKPKEGVARENRRRVLLNLHGGAFVLGHGFTQGPSESIPVAALGRIEVITLDYRQAPFHTYPAASEDVEAVYRELLKKYKPQAIGIYGCSAGGILTAQSLARFQTKGLPRPGAAGVLCMGLKWTRNARGNYPGDSGIWGFNPVPGERTNMDELVLTAGRWYMQAASKDDSLAYPGICDAVLGQFPPTLLLTGTRAIEMSSTIASHARLLRLGVDASLYVMEGGTHGEHVGSAATTPEGREANAYIAHWFNQHLAR